MAQVGPDGGVEEQDVDGAAGEAAARVAAGAHGDIADVVAVEVAEVGDRVPEGVAVAEVLEEARLLVRDGRDATQGTAVEEQGDDGAGSGEARDAHGDVRRAVLVQVVHEFDVRAEEGAHPEGHAGLLGCDAGVLPDRTVRLQVEDPDGALSQGEAGRADADVQVAVAVQVAQATDAGAEGVLLVHVVVEEVPGRLADLLQATDDAVGAEADDPHGADVAGLLLGAVVVSHRAHGDVVQPVVVQVADGREARAELVALVEHRWHAAVLEADLLMALDGSVRVEEQHPDGTGVLAGVVVTGRADHQVGNVVAVEVVDGGERGAEAVLGVELTREAALSLGDHLLRLDGTVVVQEQDPDGAAVAAAALAVVGGAHGQVDDAVAIEIAQGRRSDAQQVAVVDHATEAALAGTELLMGLDFTRKRLSLHHQCKAEDRRGGPPRERHTTLHRCQSLLRSRPTSDRDKYSVTVFRQSCRRPCSCEDHGAQMALKGRVRRLIQTPVGGRQPSRRSITAFTTRGQAIVASAFTSAHRPPSLAGTIFPQLTDSL